MPVFFSQRIVIMHCGEKRGFYCVNGKGLILAVVAVERSADSVNQGISGSLVSEVKNERIK